MDQVFSIGDKIELTPVRSAFSYDKSEKKYVSQLLDFGSIRMIKIAAPVQDGRLVPLRVDEDINLCFFTKSGLHQCRGRIKDRSVDNKLATLEVLLVSEPVKFQRRKFFRLDCSFEIQYRRLSAEELKLRRRLEEKALLKEQEIAECEKALSELPENWHKATITNLSGGGVRFHLNEPLDVGEPIEVVVPLSMQRGVESFRAFSHVVECTGESRNSKDARCEFESITNREQEMIVKYVFEEQRRRMSGGER
ncbi:MAG: flagellar brake protein [Eubacterium sp.]|nr:flagellar brake protein [Eubacterium sp.]